VKPCPKEIDLPFTNNFLAFWILNDVIFLWS
jgi:hypothetical protein